MVSKSDRIKELVDEARSFRLCGPSDDPDMQTAVAVGFRHLLVQVQRLAAPILPHEARARLEAVSVDIHSIYTVYEAFAELDALLYDIEEALEVPTNDGTVRRDSSSTAGALRLAAIQVGDALKYDTSMNEIDRVASAIFDFAAESYPHDSITSSRAQAIFDWLMTLEAQPLTGYHKATLTAQFCLSLTSDENAQRIRAILASAGINAEPAVSGKEGPLAERGFHPEVARHAGKLFEQGNFFHAVLEASKAYNQAVKQKAESAKDGRDLMLSVWSPASGLLRLQPMESETMRNVQDGIMFLSAGLMSAIRNPGAHEPAADWPIGRQDCLEILGFISFLFRKLDEAVRIGG